MSGKTARSIAAFQNLKRICEENLAGRCHIAVFDVVENPRAAFKAQIIATPTLVKELPLPVRKIVGDLSNLERVLLGLACSPSRLKGVL